MKRKLINMSRRYRAVLREHLQQGSRASLQPARALGRQAVALGLETLDLARIHQGALATLEAASSRDGVMERANTFFTEAITPIEETHRAAREAGARLSQLKARLSQRTVDLAATHRSLKQGITQRQSAERTLKERRERYKKLLEKSRHLQEHLQRLTHRILSAQEDKRQEMSHDLQDDIAQTLLGINVWLVTLQRRAGRNARDFEKEIDSTQRRVDMSLKTIERVAREFGRHHEP